MYGGHIEPDSLNACKSGAVDEIVQCSYERTDSLHYSDDSQWWIQELVVGVIPLLPLPFVPSLS